jgi:hypothetical protein
MKQFNFARHWKSKIVPVLDKPAVVYALTFGLKLNDLSYKVGDPPWLSGRGPLNGQRAREGCVSWYQPWGRCHHIAPFCWVLGRELYPDLKWGFMGGDLHTAVIGYQEAWEEPEWVMDILWFREWSATKSIGFVKMRNWEFYPHLHQYLATFSSEPEKAIKVFPKSQVAC